MSYKVGMTGGVASGKTTVSDRFSKFGIDIIDADVIARKLLEPGAECYDEVINVFGKQALLSNAQINRSWLREHIFSDAEAKQLLESIIHPAVRQSLITASESANSVYCIVSVPLLIESNMQSLVDRILVVDVPPEQQIARLMHRDKVSLEHARAMLAGQCSREQRLSFADDVIDNTQSVSELDKQITQLHQHYLSLAANHH